MKKIIFLVITLLLFFGGGVFAQDAQFQLPRAGITPDWPAPRSLDTLSTV